MPGKHAPESPRSFYLSIARATGAIVAVIVVLVVIVMAATGPSAPKTPKASGASPSASATPTPLETLSGPVDPVPTATATPEVSLDPTERARATVRVLVLNGTNPPRGGLAGKVASQLKGEGWKKTATDNAFKTDKTVIEFRSGFSQEAKALLADHPEFGAIKRGTSLPNTADIVVRIGDDYPS